ncbi:hypothetical protein Ddye_027901 [Dipteronia dyeriana]|uniref:Oligopeptide transporter n=1 Tax=Dipteronia dyeriana TaxID=168575 RepID=A0AAD9TQ70_9ROSI|nr:hypothetical protein Ddye_027901 [Dipteronia dyeriana]
MIPGKPLANVAFKTYGYISMAQALNFLSDFKLLVGTIVASTVYFCTSWWLLTSIDHICDESLLPVGSPWTCPGDEVFYNASIIWGVVGPGRISGLVALTKIPREEMAQAYTHADDYGRGSGMPAAKAVHYLSWGVVGIFFNYYIFKTYKGWWARHTYILSAALDAGAAFMGVLLYFSLQSYGIYCPTWWILRIIVNWQNVLLLQEWNSKGALCSEMFQKMHFHQGHYCLGCVYA